MSLPLYPPFILGILEESLSPKLGWVSGRFTGGVGIYHFLLLKAKVEEVAGESDKVG